MSHRIQFILWFLDDEHMKWVVVRSCSSKELYELRAELMKQDIQCEPIISERLE
jgi:hypothetical protein